MDHTPGQGQYRDIDGFKRMLVQYNEQLGDSDLDMMVKKRMEKPKLSIEECKEIAELAKSKKIAIASHDDDSIEKLEHVKEFGATISEFPITIDVAKKAQEMGLYTIAGAPNVVLGGSHAGNLSAPEAIAEGVIDVLCSDYYPASILHAVFKLNEVYGHDLFEMFKLATLNPAKAVKIEHLVGSIEKGKLADIIIIQKINNNFPVITSCFVDGANVFQVDYRI